MKDDIVEIPNEVRNDSLCLLFSLEILIYIKKSGKASKKYFSLG